jgi:hypothetical protein
VESRRRRSGGGTGRFYPTATPRTALNCGSPPGGKRPDAVTRPLDPACVAIRGSTRLVASLRPGAAPAAVSVRWRFTAATTVPRALSALRSAETRSPGGASHKKEGAHPSAPKFPETT